MVRFSVVAGEGTVSCRRNLWGAHGQLRCPDETSEMARTVDPPYPKHPRKMDMSEYYVSTPLRIYGGNTRTPVERCIRRDCLVRRCRPDTRGAVLELLLYLRDTVGQEPVDRLLRLHPREARDELPKRAYGIRLGVRARILEH